MIHSNLEWAAVFLMLFARRLLDRHWGFIDYSLIAYAALASLIYSTLDHDQINYVSRRIHLLSVVTVFFFEPLVISRVSAAQKPRRAGIGFVFNRGGWPGHQ